MQIFKQITANNINLDEYPFQHELSMEAYLMENEEILRLDNQNFSEVSVLDAEVSLKGLNNENKRIDLLARYSAEYLAVIELKLDEINMESLNQLQGYLEIRKELIAKDYTYWENEEAPKWVGVLVGSSISSELRQKLEKGYSFETNNTKIPIAGMTLKRYRSNENHIYVISDTFYNFPYGNKDYSTFIFQNKEYNKSRLVNVVIKRFVENNPEITFNQLQQKFPRDIQGSYGVFDKESIANEIYNKSGYKRFYLKPEEKINLSDEIICTSTQWGVGNIDNFIKAAKKQSLEIKIK